MKKTLVHFISLILCLGLMCSGMFATQSFAQETLVEDAISVGAAMAMGQDEYGNNYFTTFEELETITAKTYEEITTYYCIAPNTFQIQRSIHIPEGLLIMFENVRIPAGVTVTTDGYFCAMGTMSVEGTLVNSGYVAVFPDYGSGIHVMGSGSYQEKNLGITMIMSSNGTDYADALHGLNLYDFAFTDTFAEGFYVRGLYAYFDSDVVLKPGQTVPMFRMYDPYSSEHFYTGSTQERYNLLEAGWNYEGVGFNFPAVGEPVYRLYHKPTGEHLYTMNMEEKTALEAAGWKVEGIAFNSDSNQEIAQYRLHNPNATRGAYHFTGSTQEWNQLIALGWEDQGIGWYSCLK